MKAIVRTNEANSMAFLQREFLPSNDTYKTKTSAGNTLNFIRGNDNVTHSAQGETVLLIDMSLLGYNENKSRDYSDIDFRETRRRIILRSVIL